MACSQVFSGGVPVDDSRRFPVYREVAQAVTSEFVQRSVAGVCYVTGSSSLPWLCVSFYEPYSIKQRELVLRPVLGSSLWVLVEKWTDTALVRGSLHDVVEYVPRRAVCEFHPVADGCGLTVDHVDAVAHHRFVERVVAAPRAREAVVAVGRGGSVCEVIGVSGIGVYRSVREFILSHCTDISLRALFGAFTTIVADGDTEPDMFADVVVDAWTRELFTMMG